jgi:hypothetical protein
MEEGIKARQDKLDADNAKIVADREKRRADMEALNEMMERRETERKAYEEKMMAEWETGEKKEKKRKADFEKRMTKRKVDRELVAARLEANYEKTDASQMRVEPETEHEEKMDAWIADMKDGRKEDGLPRSDGGQSREDGAN